MIDGSSDVLGPGRIVVVELAVVQRQAAKGRFEDFNGKVLADVAPFLVQLQVAVELEVVEGERAEERVGEQQHEQTDVGLDDVDDATRHWRHALDEVPVLCNGND